MRSACSLATQEPHLFIYTHTHRHTCTRTHTYTSSKSFIFHQDFVNRVSHIWRTARRFLIWGCCIACKQAMTRTMRQCQQKVKKHPFLLYWHFYSPDRSQRSCFLSRSVMIAKTKQNKSSIHLGPCETTSRGSINVISEFLEIPCSILGCLTILRCISWSEEALFPGFRA